MSLTNENFNDYRMDIYDPNATQLSTQLSTSSSKVKKSTTSTYNRQPAEEFKKGIKREKDHYTTLKEDKQWDSWRRTTLATARSHACEQVFDPDYKPTTTEDKDLFDEKQKFIYSVFDDCLKTDVGKSLVRTYEATYNAQAIYKELKAHATESTQATLDTDELLTYITSTKLSKGQWRGTHHEFILHWCDQLRKYEGMINKADRFTDNVKMTMLQNAVSGVSALHQVKTQAAHDVAHGKTPLNYTNYRILLLSAATIEDEKQSFARPRPQRTVQYHERPSDPYEDPSTFDIDTEISNLEVNVTDRP